MALCILQIIDAILLPRKVEHPAREIIVVHLVKRVPAMDGTIHSSGEILRIVVAIHPMVTSTVHILQEVRLDQVLKMTVEDCLLPKEKTAVYDATVPIMPVITVTPIRITMAQIARLVV